MKKPRKFYKTVVTVTIISEGSPINEDWDLEDIRREIDCGDMVGEVAIHSTKKLGRKDTVKALYDMGSDPDFFGMDDKGRDTF